MQISLVWTPFRFDVDVCYRYYCITVVYPVIELRKIGPGGVVYYATYYILRDTQENTAVVHVTPYIYGGVMYGNVITYDITCT